MPRCIQYLNAKNEAISLDVVHNGVVEEMRRSSSTPSNDDDQWILLLDMFVLMHGSKTIAQMKQESQETTVSNLLQAVERIGVVSVRCYVVKA